VPVLDGMNHPNDNGGVVRRAGTLCFVPAELAASPDKTLHRPPHRPAE
jgi:hypothetical protein